MDEEAEEWAGVCVMWGDRALTTEEEKEANTMDKCRVCGKGSLRVMYGKRFGRYFVSCDAYPDCKTIYSLPPKGQMKPARVSKKQAEELSVEEGSLDMCKDCGFPLVQSFQRGKAPWKFCFNMECATNEEAAKKKAEFKAKMASGEVEIIGGKIVDHTSDINMTLFVQFFFVTIQVHSLDQERFFPRDKNFL